MHIALLGPFPWPSDQGSQAYLRAQARGLAGRGHRVSVIVYGGGIGGEIPGIDLIRGRPGVRFSRGGFHWSRALGDLGLVRALRRLHRQHPVDIVHAHQVEGPVVARLARLGVPIVYDLHTRMEEELGTHLPRLGAAAPRIGRRVDHLALACSDGGCAISARALATFEQAGCASRLIGPAVDPAELEVEPDPTPRVVYTGNLDAYQDLELLYAALPLPVPLWVVTGSRGLVPEGVRVIRDGRPEVALRALAGATAAVVPRRTVAGFPIKLLNSLGLGVPTVVMRSAGIALPGLVQSTPERLRADLVELIERPDTAAALGRAGREWVFAEATLDARAEALEALYAQLLSPARRP